MLGIGTSFESRLFNGKNMNEMKLGTLKALSVVTSLISLFLYSFSVAALDLKLTDRLKTPSRHFEHFEKTAFLDLELVGNRLVTAGERGVIGFSDDGGVTWKQSQVPVSTLMTAIYFPTERIGWAVGHSGSLLQSKDQGETWDLVIDGVDINNMLVEHAKNKLDALKQEYSLAGDYKKEDLQYAVEDAEFELSNAEYDVSLGPANPFLDVLFVNSAKGFAVGAYGLFILTEDGGKTWRSISHRLENFDRYHLNTISEIKGGALIIAGEAGTLFASYDGGEQWETLYGPYQGSFFGLQPTLNSDEAVLFGLKGHIFKTQDSGRSWKRIQVDAETSLTSSSISQNGAIVLAGLSGVVLISSDNGNSFRRIKTKGFEGFNDVEFVEENSLVLVSDEGIQLLKTQ